VADWITEEDLLGTAPRQLSAALTLQDGSHVGVIGGGPAGSFFAFFVLDLAERMGLELQVDLYEPRNYTKPGPAGCNHCGGIISESMVQLLATEGIDLPDHVIQRGIDSYVVHMGVGSTRIDTPLAEKRIAAVHRGAGPRGVVDHRWGSFDGHMLGLALAKGATLIDQRVDSLEWVDDYPQATTRKGVTRTYDLLVGASGINSNSAKLFEGLGIGYQRPPTSKTYICEFPLGAETVESCLGNAMHVFLENIPRLEFAALIPKGDYVTVCLIGERIDKELVRRFLTSDSVRTCFPPGWEAPESHCHCSPAISVGAASIAYSDRLVLIGDCGVTRLYKDGIGSAYRTAKAAANTAVFHGIARSDFDQHYRPVIDAIVGDNRLGRWVFVATALLQKAATGRRAVLRRVRGEARNPTSKRTMSTMMWDTFTGSAPYGEILRRALDVGFLSRTLRDTLIEVVYTCIDIPRRVVRLTKTNSGDDVGAAEP
jgi:flavin-dependent dehydrogenase